MIKIRPIRFILSKPSFLSVVSVSSVANSH